uniref:Alpha 1,4-glycosyltransferase domain-containing protein n=1 Tax=Alexandrium monilatum TaxID=311494 RepID=A0A7S4VRY4_9DINO
MTGSPQDWDLAGGSGGGAAAPTAGQYLAEAAGGGCGEVRRWGVWSPSDRRWSDEAQRLWQLASRAGAHDGPRIPRRIHQIWLGPRPIPRDCVEMMESWKAAHPSWEYTLWTDLDAESALATPNLREAFAGARNPAEMSDVVRLGLILQHGGLYVDVDFECLQPFDELHGRFSFFAGLSNVGVFELNNGLFAARPRHPLVDFLCGRVGRPWPEWGGGDVDPREAVAHQLERSGVLGGALAPGGRAPFLATTGPGFFTRGVMSYLGSSEAERPISAPVAICPAELFYPLPNAHRGRSRAERRACALPASLAVHHWRCTWQLGDDEAEGGGRE